MTRCVKAPVKAIAMSAATTISSFHTAKPTEQINADGVARKTSTWSHPRVVNEQRETPLDPELIGLARSLLWTGYAGLPAARYLEKNGYPQTVAIAAVKVAKRKTNHFGRVSSQS